MNITTATVSSITNEEAFSGGTITGTPGDYLSLMDWMLVNKFRLYKASQQIITATIYSTIPLRPFMLFQDDKQSNKKFILVGYRYLIETDMYEIQLYEYDNTTTVNLI